MDSHINCFDDFFFSLIYRPPCKDYFALRSSAFCNCLGTESNIKDVWNCQVFYKTTIQLRLRVFKSSIGYFSRINILLMITVSKLQPQLVDYYLPQMRLYVPWLLFRLVEFSNNIATLAEISSEFFREPGEYSLYWPLPGRGAHNYLWAPASTERHRPKDHLFQACIRKARGGGTPHMKGVGMLVGNFELKP